MPCILTSTIARLLKSPVYLHIFVNVITQDLEVGGSSSGTIHMKHGHKYVLIPFLHIISLELHISRT